MNGFVVAKFSDDGITEGKIYEIVKIEKHKFGWECVYFYDDDCDLWFIDPNIEKENFDVYWQI